VSATWQAPGRVNLIGEHVDYNDGFVLPFALQFTTRAELAERDDDIVNVASESEGTDEFPTDTKPGDVDGWAAYVAGVVWAFSDHGFDVGGLDISISSDVPTGAGLSSSAALTCAVGSALNDILDAGLSPTEIATLARRSENEYVGVPTGPMDQLAAMLCTEDHALLLDCRSLETRSIPFDPIASGLRVLLIDTTARHSLVGSQYGDRRKDCDDALAELDEPTWRDVDLSMIDRLSSDRLRRRARHILTETKRVLDIAEILDTGRAADIGSVLTTSHASMRDDFEISCDELDVTVDAALDAGALGARMVGGGFGGCALVLCRDEDSDQVVTRVRAAYSEHGWEPPELYTPKPSQGAHRIT
jgi:galactokinase